ncbi:rac GTPase-activating protein 1-like isoform X3 [Podarcis raffonei]|uniref:rac GTPase-activating protein 1-like isoform X3 n=1 Tax=Podarcis raffonei TaxID=65483 RepID=UPI0023296FE9|nr:rac GTPase-activating protein 1-like isoform X3 [Podarcis raffonei]
MLCVGGCSNMACNLSRMNCLYPQLMRHMDQLLSLIEFNRSIELDCLQIAKCLEGMRQRCCRLDCDLQGTREKLRQSEYECSVLEVKLKHARNQVEVEMKKRHRAEAELEKQERKLQLIYDYLMADSQISPFNEDQRSALAALERPRFSHSTLLPGKCRPSAVEGLGASIISDISFDHSDDEVDLEVIKSLKSRDKGCSSLVPLIQPVATTKSAQTSVAPPPPSANKMSVATLRSGATAHVLPPIPVVPRRRSQQRRCLSTRSDVTSFWGSSEGSGRSTGNSQAESDTIGTKIRTDLRGVQDPFSPSPTQGTPPLQEHHFTSKTMISLESCAVCKSRLRFGKMALKCRPCQLVVHPECKERSPSVCRPTASPRAREGILADFAPSTPPLVPPLVIQCVNQVERRGLKEAGLYRVPGSEHLIREWKRKLLCARGALPSLDQVADVNVICGVLKDFLRSLKEPLVTFALHPAFLHASEIPDEAARQTALCHVVMKLPLANRDTLAFLVLHLHRVMQSPECRMDRHNLARIFGPTLVGHGTPSPSPRIIMEDTPRQCLVVSNLLALPLSFWRHFVREEQENLVPSVQKPSVVNEQDQIFFPLTPPEVSTIQMSPGGGCLPNKLWDCIGTTFPPSNASRTKKTGKFFPLPVS